MSISSFNKLGGSRREILQVSLLLVAKITSGTLQMRHAGVRPNTQGLPPVQEAPGIPPPLISAKGNQERFPSPCPLSLSRLLHVHDHLPGAPRWAPGLPWVQSPTHADSPVHTAPNTLAADANAQRWEAEGHCWQGNSQHRAHLALNIPETRTSLVLGRGKA